MHKTVWRSAFLKPTILIFASLSLTVFSSSASACSPEIPPVEQAVREVVSTGYLVSGTVVQPFDAAKHQPEIILADRIFVGEGAPREFKIYRTENDYQRHARRPGTIPCLGRAFKESGYRYERFVLIPAPKKDDGSSDGQWIMYWNDWSVTTGKGLEMLLAEAERLGRFNERPPPNRWFDG
jgi:hypothetical protein